MNGKNLMKNRGLLAIILGMAAIAVTGGLSAVYASSDSNQTQNQMPPQIQGSINLQQNIMSSVQTSFATAEATAASAVTNGKVIGGSLTVIQGSVVYDFQVIDNENLVYSVIVDAGNGKVLYTSQVEPMDFGFGMGPFGIGSFGMGGNCPMDGGPLGWNAPPQTSSNPAATPSGNTPPTSGQIDTPTESQV